MALHLALLLIWVLLVLTACGGEDRNIGATATLSWDPLHDPSVAGYRVHYGKDSAGEPGSCSYEHSVDVSEPTVMITHLEFSTRYYFVVSAYAYDGMSGLCSEEVSKQTPELEPHIGDPPVKVLQAAQNLHAATR